jgi:hypothetical protein
MTHIDYIHRNKTHFRMEEYIAVSWGPSLGTSARNQPNKARPMVAHRQGYPKVADISTT